MAERRQGAAFYHLHVTTRRRPVGIALERKVGAEAQTAGDRHQRLLDPPAQAVARADPRRDDDLATGTADARELVQRLFRVGHGGDDILRDHHVEAVVGELQSLGIAIRDLLDMGKIAVAHPLARLVEHRLGQVYADDTVGSRILGSEMPVPTPPR